MQKILFCCGALAGLSAVAMASAAAHALPPAALPLVRIALQIHGWHALALLACAAWLPRGGRWTQAAGLCFAAGTLIFSGSVYALGLGLFHLPMAAPVGGTILLVGWLLLVIAAWR